MLACVQHNAPLNQIKTVNVPSTSTLNVSADEYQPRASNIQTVSRSENNIKYSPSVLIELLDGNGMWRKAVALPDSGSDATLIKQDTDQNFHLKSNRKPYSRRWFLSRKFRNYFFIDTSSKSTLFAF